MIGDSTFCPLPIDGGSGEAISCLTLKYSEIKMSPTCYWIGHFICLFLILSVLFI
mgnify:CR=1 FL=1